MAKSRKGRDTEKGMTRNEAVRKGEAHCPECDGRISLKSPRHGQKVTCNHCRTRLVVDSMSPLELDWAA